MIVFDEHVKEPLYLQLYKQLKQKILSGEYAENSKLPSTRAMAKTLTIGRNTVENAYAQLVSEGYVESKAGSGFIINKIDGVFDIPQQQTTPVKTVSERLPGSNYNYNFQYGRLNGDDFPFKLWRKFTNYSLAPSGLHHFVAYNDRQGELDLRIQIMKYLNASRGVQCQPDQIVLCSGTQACLALISQLVRQHSTDIAFEEPAYDGARDVFVNNGYNVIPIPLQKDGIDLNLLEQTKAKIVYITPSHQFPTGAVLPIQKRLNLLDWAERNKAVIIEDDYDSELRYNSRPIPSVQSLDSTGQVIYLGTFSKTLAPALRLSYMVLPEAWLKIYQHKFKNYHNFVPWLQQKTLAYFMSLGHWERHIRKICLVQKKKHDLLIRTIRELLDTNVIIHGENAGLHILLEFPGKTEQELIEKAGNYGVLVYPVSKYWLRPENYASNMVLIGFSSLNSQDIIEGLHLLKTAWFSD